MPAQPTFPATYTAPLAAAPYATTGTRPSLGGRTYSHPAGAVPERLSRIDGAGAEGRDRGSSREYASSDEEGEDDDDPEQVVAGVQAGGSALQTGVVAGERPGQRGHLLLTSTVHNPSDALRMLATASASAPRLEAMAPPSGAGVSPGAGSEGGRAREGQEPTPALVQEGGGAGVAAPHTGGWETWQPVVDRVLSQEEGEALLDL